MKLKSEETKDLKGFKHKTKRGENYFLTIFDDSGIKTINISKLNKKLITFGNGKNNDITISSDIIATRQGYFEITEYGVLAVNTTKGICMKGTDNRIYDEIYLAEGSFIKINSQDNDPTKGILIVMSIGRNLNEWKEYSLKLGRNTLGSEKNNDIVLPSKGIAKKHASIYYFRNNITIADEGSLNGIYINRKKILPSKNKKIENLDVILIGNSKIVVFGDKLIYQLSESGVQVDALDIVKKVRVKLKTQEIASHTSMTIKPSEFVAFVGGSGAGKSTFMKCISGVDRPTSGKVLINGENLYDNYDELKYNIGYVPQEDIVYSNLTLHDTLQYAAKLRMPDNTTRKERNIRIKEVLEIVQLTELENSYIRQLSGGQRKRASIAVELIADPNLFFLDEPTSGLDPGTERSIMLTLRKMAEMGKTVILVTHNTLNLHLCDKVAFFGKGGKLCFFGRPKEALKFFGVDDFVDIYTLLNEDVGLWYNKFKSIEETVNVEEEIEEKTKIKKKKKSFFRQLMILISRYIKLITNDFQQLFLLIAQAPIVAILLAMVASEDIYSSYDDTKAIMFSIGCASIWLGLLNSVQEICKEKVILQKEHMADLKLSSYLLSKFIVQGIIAFIQATLLVGIFQKIVGSSEHSILIDGYWDIQLVSFLSILAAASTGLFISAVVKNSNIAMSVIPLILVPQLLYSGMLFKLDGITDFVSNFVLCRWTVEALGTSVNLNDLTHIAQTINPLIEIEPENYFTFTTEHMIEVIGIILLMTAVLMLASYFVLRKNVNKNM